MSTKHTGTMPWDKDFDELDEEYQKLFPMTQRRFTFTEIRKKYFRRKNEDKILQM